MMHLYSLTYLAQVKDLRVLPHKILQLVLLKNALKTLPFSPTKRKENAMELCKGVAIVGVAHDAVLCALNRNTVVSFQAVGNYQKQMNYISSQSLAKGGR